MKTRYQVTARDKDGNILSRNIRYTKEGAEKLASKSRKKKNVKSAKVEIVK